MPDLWEELNSVQSEGTIVTEENLNSVDHRQGEIISEEKKTHGLKTCIIGGNMECYFIVQDGRRSLVGDVITFSQTKEN